MQREHLANIPIEDKIDWIEKWFQHLSTTGEVLKTDVTVLWIKKKVE